MGFVQEHTSTRVKRSTKEDRVNRGSKNFCVKQGLEFPIDDRHLKSIYFKKTGDFINEEQVERMTVTLTFYKLRPIFPVHQKRR